MNKDVIRKHNISLKNHNNLDFLIPSAEASICLNCTLPSKKCKPLQCQRYKDEMRKIKEKDR